MLKSSCIRHPANHPLVIVRQWQIEACDGDKCAAALLSFFEFCHNIKLSMRGQAHKANRVAREHGEAGTHPTTLIQWHDEAELEAGIQNLYKRSTISKSLEVLYEKGFVERVANPSPRYKFDRTRYFLFHPYKVQDWLDEHYPPALPTPEVEEEQDDEEGSEGGTPHSGGAPYSDDTPHASTQDTEPDESEWDDDPFQGIEDASVKNNGRSFNFKGSSVKNNAPSTKNNAPSVVFKAPSTKNNAPSVKNNASTHTEYSAEPSPKISSKETSKANARETEKTPTAGMTPEQLLAFFEKKWRKKNGEENLREALDFVRWDVEMQKVAELFAEYSERALLVHEYLTHNPDQMPRTGGGVRSMVTNPDKWPRVARWAHEKAETEKQAQENALRAAEAKKAALIAAAAKAEAEREAAEREADIDEKIAELLDTDPLAHQQLQQQAFQQLGHLDRLRLEKDPLSPLPRMALRERMRTIYSSQNIAISPTPTIH